MMGVGALAPAAFLDRDGVINVDEGYVRRVDQFVLLPGVRAACRRIAAAGYRLVVVTNQGGIALDYYSEQDYADITRHMLGLFAAAGVRFDGVYHSPYHPRAPERHLDRRDWRKPAPGMLLTAAAELGLDLSASFMVGDKPTDMEAAAAAGVPRRYFIGADAPNNSIPCRSLPHVAKICVLSC